MRTVKKVAKKEARKAIDKLNPTGHEVSLFPAGPWGSITPIAAGTAITHQLGKSVDLGTNAGDRLSNKIMYKGIRYTFRIRNTISSSSRWCMRVLVVHAPNVWGDPTATGGKLWQSDTDSLAPVDFTSNDINNLINKVNRNRYRVLHDKKHWFNPSDAWTQGITFVGDRICTGYVKVNKTLRYNSTYLAGSDGIQPNIWLIAFIQNQSGGIVTLASEQLKYGVRYDEYFKKQ